MVTVTKRELWKETGLKIEVGEVVLTDSSFLNIPMRINIVILFWFIIW